MTVLLANLFSDLFCTPLLHTEPSYCMRAYSQITQYSLRLNYISILQEARTTYSYFFNGIVAFITKKKKKKCVIKPKVVNNRIDKVKLVT